MPRRSRPAVATRSEHWLRVAVNDSATEFNRQIRQALGFDASEEIEWLSPVRSDGYAEYYDQEFVERLGLSALKVPLSEFWPRSGPRWDGLAKTNSGKLILVEAKAYIEEAVDFGSKAGPDAAALINESLAAAKGAFGANSRANWEEPLYQYANRLAHLYYLRKLNNCEAHLLFVYFADAPDVPRPTSSEQWAGAIRLADSCLGISARHPLTRHVGKLVWSVDAMIEERG